MRLAGKIREWNDDKGFGFVVPVKGGDFVFAHIHEFQRGSRRPAAGDIVTYRLGKDPRGRFRAFDVRYAGEKAQSQREPVRLPRAAMGATALIAAAGAAAVGVMPVFLAGIYVVLSGVSYLMYRSDKTAAGRDESRTPESALHWADLLGGWPGALIAQQQFRHKTIKKSFQFVFWMTVAFNLAAVGWLIWSGKAVQLWQSLLRQTFL